MRLNKNRQEPQQNHIHAKMEMQDKLELMGAIHAFELA